MKVKPIAVRTVRLAKKNLPTILTIVGVVSTVGAVVAAIRATPEATRLISEAKREKIEDPCSTDISEVELTKREIVKVVWKCYIPTATAVCMSAGCMIYANSINLKRNAALATLCTATDMAYREYRNKVSETLGEAADKTVRDAIAKDKLDKHPLSEAKVSTKLGDTKCFETWSGRYFDHDVEKIKHAINEFNRRVIIDGFASLNDFYYDIGLDNVKNGDDIGWKPDTGLLEIAWSAQLTDDGQPCVVLDFVTIPKPDY